MMKCVLILMCVFLCAGCKPKSARMRAIVEKKCAILLTDSAGNKYSARYIGGNGDSWELQPIE